MLIATVILILITIVESREKCRDFFDSKGLYKTQQFCDEGYFCCGQCSNRYCCDNAPERLEQSFCPNLFNYDLLVESVILVVGIIVFKCIFIGFICLCQMNTRSSKQVTPVNSAQNQVMTYKEAIKNSVKVDVEAPPPYPGISYIEIT